MPHFQPRPLVVIRNQLLAFLVLHLLGSCVPNHHVQPSGAVMVSANSHKPPAAVSDTQTTFPLI